MKTILLLGSNLENPLKQLEIAISKISAEVGECKLSSIYKTAAWGNTEQNDFYNQGVELHTELNPSDLLKKLIEIELSMGRTRIHKWEPRIIDIDIIAMEDSVINTEELQIPHPHMANRKFVLIPMFELDENWVHPIFQKPIKTLLEECEDELEVHKL